MIVEEESACDVESNEHVNTVVFMSGEDKEDPKAVTKPSEGVEEEDPPGGVLGDEEVEECERDCVT